MFILILTILFNLFYQNLRIIKMPKMRNSTATQESKKGLDGILAYPD